MTTETKMDEFMALLPTQEIRKKINIGNDILSYLSDETNSLECSDIGMFIDSVVPWLQNSNFKVAQNGLEILTHIADRLGSDFRPYITTILGSVIDRLGDTKESVREKCKVLLIKLLQKDVISPNNLFEKLLPAFSHKNSKVRDEVMKALVLALNEHGAQGIALIRLVPHLVKLISDPLHEVRETAFATLAEVYRHVGEKLRTDIQKNYKIFPQHKVVNLFAKFDEVKATGRLLPSAGANAPYEEDEPDRAPRPRKIFEKRLCPTYGTKTTVAPSPKPAAPAGAASSTPAAGTSSSIPGPKYGRTPTTTRKTPAAAGAVDEEAFLSAFEDVPSIPLISHKELDNVLKKIREQISTATGENWEKRVDAMKRLRAVLLSGAQYDEIVAHIRNFDIPLETSLKDLRSQVVREACITVSFLAQQLQQKFDHTAEFVLPALMGLIQNSAKVISSSGILTIKFIITYTHAPRLVSILVSNLSSKSREIRRATCECIDLLLHSWSTHSLERHIALIQDSIKKGLADADSETRIFARKSFWGFKKHFPDQADALLGTLDARCKQKLFGDAPGSMSNSSSINTIHQSGLGGTSSAGASRVSKSEAPRRLSSGSTPVPAVAVRSNSAIDLHAAQRAKARSQYAALARQKVGSGGTLPRAKKLPDLASPPPQAPPVHAAHPLSGGERVGRPRSRVTGVSHSQPSSRSGSPSSKLNYATYNFGPEPVFPPRSRTQNKPFCRSTGTSRETSPNRYSILQPVGMKYRQRPLISMLDRPPMHSTRPVMAQKILQQSREAESALADALSCDPAESVDPAHKHTLKRAYKTSDDHSDDSETSSVCSERSDTFRRPSDSYSWSGSQQRLYRDLWEPSNKGMPTIGEIIANCESTHWSDRKEGLVGLQGYFQYGNVLTPIELKRVTDNFTKMFMDSHTKVFSLFLDTLNDLIMTHRQDLNSWLYVLLTRLLNKLGADLLGSIQTKIHKSLEVVRESFPCELQLLSVLRFLVDATQTPNARVKTAALNYVTKLAAMTDPHLAFPPPSPGQVKDTATAAITKMIGWTMGDSIKQGSELRRAAQEAILALFNLNTPQVTMRFSQLPKEYQEAAATLIHGRVRRSSNGGSNTSTQSPPSSTPTSPILHSPAPQRQRFSPHSSDTENLNPEEVYRSLRKTTAEIQNYSYESGRGKLTEQITTSQDSGISQMSPVDRLEEQMEHLALRSVSGSHSLPVASPGNGSDDSNGYSTRVLTPRDCNGTGVDTTDGGSPPKDSSYQTEGLEELSEAMRKIMESLKPSSDAEAVSDCRTPLSEEEKKAALTELLALTRECSPVVILEHFKCLLRVLLGLMSTTNGTIKSLVLGILAEMLKKRALTDNFNNYVELIILKVLQVYKDPCKDAVRAAELCINGMALMMAPDMVIRVLAPLIATEDFPVNLASIKMLTRVVENRGRDPVINYLPELMPGLIQAYDNEDSSVRKSAVFCMVALHSAVGEEALKPHLAALNGSKLKLLHLYIRRSHQGSSAPTSPKNQPPSSS